MTVARVMVPVLTLMNANGSVDEGACSAYAERAGATWLDLFLVSGTIGGGESSTPTVRRRVLELWAARVPKDRLLACVWAPDDLAHAADCGVRPIVVLRDLADAAAMHSVLAELPADAFVYSHPNYTPTTFTPAVAETARRAGMQPAGGKICKVSLDDVRDLRAATGDGFQLYDGRCRHVAESVRAGAALMCDERGVPCHLVCAQAEADAPTEHRSTGDDGLAVVVDLPIAPVIDLSTRRRIA
ncbi:hypothetical protein AB0M46_47290 [Dactylosporangium sp. NPDC051485]|uniref:dihydrodipicolinate synthase family protein n=1 Tax=Dactylosporangium sp. NPDC051485 TaxID=3154846 RepID=UPI003447A2BA